VTGFSPSDILGLRMPKEVKFDIKAKSSTRMTRILKFLENVSYLRQNLPKTAKKAKNAKKVYSSQRATVETTNSRNAEIGTTIAHGLRMMAEFFT